jgi:hypothetical protein
MTKTTARAISSRTNASWSRCFMAASVPATTDAQGADDAR